MSQLLKVRACLGPAVPGHARVANLALILHTKHAVARHHVVHLHGVAEFGNARYWQRQRRWRWQRQGRAFAVQSKPVVITKFSSSTDAMCDMASWWQGAGGRATRSVNDDNCASPAAAGAPRRGESARSSRSERERRKAWRRPRASPAPHYREQQCDAGRGTATGAQQPLRARTSENCCRLRTAHRKRGHPGAVERREPLALDEPGPKKRATTGTAAGGARKVSSRRVGLDEIQRTAATAQGFHQCLRIEARRGSTPPPARWRRAARSALRQPRGQVRVADELLAHGSDHART